MKIDFSAHVDQNKFFLLKTIRELSNGIKNSYSTVRNYSGDTHDVIYFNGVTNIRLSITDGKLSISLTSFKFRGIEGAIKGNYCNMEIGTLTKSFDVSDVTSMVKFIAKTLEIESIYPLNTNKCISF